jgi:hypothetical protein
MASTNDRDYIVGSTVHLKVSTRDPVTRAPLDPPTPPTLDDLDLVGAEVTLPTTVLFAQVTPGEYVLALQTVGFAPGLYTWRARATDAAGDVALSEDTFVLRAAT